MSSILAASGVATDLDIGAGSLDQEIESCMLAKEREEGSYFLTPLQ